MHTQVRFDKSPAASFAEATQFSDVDVTKPPEMGVLWVQIFLDREPLPARSPIPTLQALTYKLPPPVQLPPGAAPPPPPPPEKVPIRSAKWVEERFEGQPIVRIELASCKPIFQLSFEQSEALEDHLARVNKVYMWVCVRACACACIMCMCVGVCVCVCVCMGIFVVYV